MNAHRRMRTLIVAGIAGAALLGLFAATVVPTDIQLPGTQPLQVSSLQTTSKCDNCHGGYDAAVEPAYNWRGGMMSQAGRDPLYWATVAVAEQDFSGSGDLCLRCHAPDGWISGRSTPTDGSALSAADGDGVACDLCHRMTDPDGSEWDGVQSAPFLAHDEGNPPQAYSGSGMYVLWPSANEKLGPYADAQPTHAFLQSTFHRKSEFCGTCHDVSNSAVGDLAHNHGALAPLAAGSWSGVPGAPVQQKAAFNNFPYAYGVVERTFSEHQSSAFATLKVSDYSTLPAELKAGAIQSAWQAALAGGADGNYADGEVRTFSCQTCHMRPVTGKGCNKAGVPLRSDLPLHDQTGGNVWVPDAITYLDGLGKLVLGGGLSAAQQAALTAGKGRALQNLQQASQLVVQGDTLKLINLTGHKLISGYPEGRRMWLHTRWYDGQDTLLREDGAYGPLSVQIGGQPATVNSILHLDPPDTRIYAAHYGMTQEWAAQLLALGYPASLPLAYDRLSGAVGKTLGQLAAQAPGTSTDTLRFALNNTVAADNRIPPYGFAYDQAAERNTLPVPAGQYGDPGPGGVYRYWDEVLLSPPAGAVRAEIELLYQSTSWEYIQFLALANDGSEPFLASTGDDLLDAWLNTGMAAPTVMSTATWTGQPGAWTDLGSGLAGSHGVPRLSGSGTLAAGTPGSLSLKDAAPSAVSLLFVSFTHTPVPFKGGTLVTVPIAFQFTLLTGPAGTLTLPWASWPGGLPHGFALYFQFAIQDAAAVQGVALSNALRGVVP
jgi:hypothetical protein